MGAPSSNKRSQLGGETIILWVVIVVVVVGVQTVGIDVVGGVVDIGVVADVVVESHDC